MTRVAILDYGMGNLRSVEKALARAGAEPLITADPDRAGETDGVVLPGVGAFPRAMSRVRERGFDALVEDLARASVPMLGICLGMQLLFECSSELDGADGIGVLEGEVRELAAPGLKLPHIGWEPVRWERGSELTAGIADGTPFYFVHSYAPRPGDSETVLGTAEHGERFVCAVASGRVWGFQFHPEKSSAAGLRIYANFVRVCASVAA